MKATSCGDYFAYCFIAIRLQEAEIIQKYKFLQKTKKNKEKLFDKCEFKCMTRAD